VGTTTTEIIAMAEEDRRFLGGNSRGPDYHDAFIKIPREIGRSESCNSQERLEEANLFTPPPRETSFLPSNERGNSTEYMDYQQWRRQLSLQLPREMNVGGEHGI
jgi:hypothetical protein